MKKKILFTAAFKAPAGYSTAARGYLKCLDEYLKQVPNSFELKIDVWNIEQPKLTEEEAKLIEKYELKNRNELEDFCKDEYEVIWFITPSDYIISGRNYENILLKAKKVTNIVVWETQKVPTPWLETYKKFFHQIIVPCDWNKEVFESQTSLPTYKIPYILPEVTKVNKKLQNKNFNILSMSQWTSRKGFDILVKAYCSEFYNQEDVLLTIKTYGFGPATGKFEEDRNHIINDIKSYKMSISHYFTEMRCKINVVTGLLSRQEIDLLMDSSDIFCLPTRGEGFGLTIAESLKRGIPVITPNKGGHLDFIHKDNFFIDSRYTTSTGVRSPDYSSVEMKLVESDMDDLRLKLRESYELWKKDPEHLRNIGLVSQKNIENYCNQEKITQDLVSVILK